MHYSSSDQLGTGSVSSILVILNQVARKYKDKGPSETDLVKCLCNIKTSMIGLGDLFSQKLLFANAAIGLNIPVLFFKYCLPASTQHMRVTTKAAIQFCATGPGKAIGDVHFGKG